MELLRCGEFDNKAIFDRKDRFTVANFLNEAKQKFGKGQQTNEVHRNDLVWRIIHLIVKHRNGETKQTKLGEEEERKEDDENRKFANDWVNFTPFYQWLFRQISFEKFSISFNLCDPKIDVSVRKFCDQIDEALVGSNIKGEERRLLHSSDKLDFTNFI